MHRKILSGKIHRATVTGADVDYEGSITVDADLLDAAGILEHEAVHIWDVDTGARLVTYAVAGQRDSGIVCVNGAAARLVHAGNRVIIASFVDLEDAECSTWQPSIVFVDADNRITACREELAGQSEPMPL